METGPRLIEGGYRSDGTTRKPIPVMEGYQPPDEAVAYVPPHKKDQSQSEMKVSAPLSSMYHMRPFEPPNKPVYPSTSGMYCMRPYFPVQPTSSNSLEMNSHESNNISSSHSEDAIKHLESTHLTIQKELSALKTRVDACNKKVFPTEKGSQEKASHFAELEKKQESIHQQLNTLKQEMSLFKQQRKSGSARSTPEPPRRTPLLPDIPVDAVIKCHPDRPPIATFLVFSHLQQFTPTSWRSMSHSSLSDPQPHLFTLLQHVQKQEKPRIVLTLIWRGELAEPSLQVSAAHTPIYGDHNIARYLCRLYVDSLYEGLGAMQATEVDQWVNSFSTQLLAGSSKERQNVLKTLNAHFGKSRWLVGDQLSLADFVAFSLLTNCEVTGEGKLQKNVIEWIKLTSKEPPFSLPNLQPLFSIPQS